MIAIELAVGVAIVLAALAILLALSERRARRERLRFRILEDVARVADGGGSMEEALEAISAILVPDYADFCMIDLVTGDGVRRAAVRASGPEREEVERGLLARKPALQEQMAEDAEVAPQPPRFFERASEADLRAVAEDEEDLEFLLGLGIRSGVTVELRARGRVTGMLSFGVAWSGRRYRPDDARFAWVLSGRVALALDNAGLFSDLERSERERSRIAETLQRGLLPPPLPHIPGWSIAAVYRPAGSQNEIGGDFYDAFRIPDGWMVVIGDVTGRGAYAASITAQARFTLRTAAALIGDPLVALATLNRALLARRDSALCSVAAIAIAEDPERPLRLAVAGHPPPLLVEAGGVSEVAPADPVLGAFAEAEWALSETSLEPGQQLVVVTDGITEACGEAGRFGEERLRAGLAGTTSPALAAQKVEGALHDFTGGRLEDDVAILAVGPGPTDAEPLLDDEPSAVVGRLYEAFNRRDQAEIAAVCDEGMEFFPIGTAEAVGRSAPYVGPSGLRDYLADVEQVWEELQIAPMAAERRGESVLIQGRVYARSRELGIRDMPVAWIWQVRSGRVVRGEVFPDPQRGSERFAAVPA